MTTNEIVVYGKPGCFQCKATTHHLNKLGLPYRYVDVTEDQTGHDIVTLLGYKALPVVVAGDVHWGNYRHEKLEQLAKVHAWAPFTDLYELPAEDYLKEEWANER